MDEWSRSADKMKTVPSHSSEVPAKEVIDFYKFLKKKGVTNGRLLDLGSGKGRHALFFAKRGFHVDCIDYIPFANQTLIQRAHKYNLSKSINVTLGEVDSKWPYPSNQFDVILDSLTSVSIEIKAGREAFIAEVFRTLKPNGYVLIRAVSTNDEWEKYLMENHPGEEKNTSIWPDTGKVQKNFSESELKEWVSKFAIIEMKEIKKKAYKLGKNFTATNFYLIITKLS